MNRRTRTGPNAVTARILADEAARILRHGPAWDGLDVAGGIAEDARAFAADILERLARGERVEFAVGKKKEPMSNGRYIEAMKRAMHEPIPARNWRLVFDRACKALGLKDDRDLRRAWSEHWQLLGAKPLLPKEVRKMKDDGGKSY